MINSNFRETLIKNNTISIIGAGGWGTALSTVLVNNGFNIRIWAKEKETVDDININHQNSTFLPNVKLDEHIYASNNLEEFRDEEFIITAVPTQFIRTLFKDNKLDLTNKYILNIAKGIEKNTLLRCSQIFIELGLNPENYVVITGPSHAEEVALQIPTTIVSASEDYDLALFVQNLLSNEYFRIYTNNDLIGCELGGSLKNVIVIRNPQFGNRTRQ